MLKAKLLLPMAARTFPPASRRGFILWELAALCAALLVGSAFVFAQSESVRRQHCKEQVRAMALLLASDIRQMQRRGLFQSASLGSTLNVASEKNYYYFVKGTQIEKTVYFSAFGCGEVYLVSTLHKLDFGSGGAPSASGAITLCHRAIEDFSCKVEVQPITGRVLVGESS